MSQGIAILGAGLFAKEAHLPALAALGASALPLKAVYSRSEKSAHDLAASAKSLLGSAPAIYYDVPSVANSLDALLARSDISAVILVLPIPLQPSIILKALAAGKHVLSEKPIAPTVLEGRKLVDEYNAKYKSKGLIWRVAENFEAEPGHRRAGEVIKSGAIGDVTWWSARVVNYVDETSKWYKTPWRTVPDYQGGFLLDGGVHTCAALRTILPSAPTHLSAHAALHKKILLPHDTIVAVTKAPQGVFEMTFAAPAPSLGKGTNGLTFVGTKGYLTISQARNANDEGVIRVTVTKAGAKAGEAEKVEVIDEKGRGVQEELRSFFAAVGGKDDGLGGLEGALWDVAFIQAGLTSEGKEIDLGALVKSG